MAPPVDASDTDLLKTCYTVFLNRQDENERPELYEMRHDKSRLGQRGDGKHTLTLQGITPQTLQDLEERASTTEALLRLLESPGVDFEGRTQLLRVMNDTIVTTISMLFHLHVEVMRFSGRDFPKPAKPWSVINEIAVRGAQGARSE